MTTSLPGYALLEATVGAERLGPYLLESRGDHSLAVALYLWNGRLAGALWELIGFLEVATRNAMAAQLDRLCRDARPQAHWYNHTAWWSTTQREQLRDAKRNAARNPPVTDGKIIAQLAFGFWVGVLEAPDQLLWVPGLHSAFPHSVGKRNVVHGTLRDINGVRNDIAHHTRLWKRGGLEKAEDKILRATYWVHPPLADWLASVSQVRSILAQRPTLPPSIQWQSQADRE